ncbi:unnamed protein product [Lathyrus sativus]|nr:unnamed protein product [Lathyrus sativus]
MRKSGRYQDESSNAMIQSIVPSAGSTWGGNRPGIAKLPTASQPNLQCKINMMGIMTDCNFYIPDVTGDPTGMAFRVAYEAATKCIIPNHVNKFIAYVGSMLCSVVPDFRNSVEAALNEIGIRPCFVSLPSQACANKIVDSEVTRLDWSSILFIFSYCVLTLFKIKTSYPSKFSNRDWIDELRSKIGRFPSNCHYIPFHVDKERAIRRMLSTHDLRNSVITFLMNNFNHSDSQICSLCQHLSVILSWSGDMNVLTVIMEMLVETESPVLFYSVVRGELDNFKETCSVVLSHTYPQFFSHMY